MKLNVFPRAEMQFPVLDKLLFMFQVLHKCLTVEFKVSRRLPNKLGLPLEVSTKRAALFCLRSWLSGSMGANTFSLKNNIMLNE